MPHSFWAQQTMNQIALTPSNGLSPLTSVSLSNPLSRCNYFFQDKWLVLLHFIHMQKTLLMRRSISLFSHWNLSKKSPYTFHVRTWPCGKITPSWDASSPVNTAVHMGPLKQACGMKLGKKKLLLKQFTKSASSHSSGKQSGKRLIRRALKEMFLMYSFCLVTMTLNGLAHTEWL